MLSLSTWRESLLSVLRMADTGVEMDRVTTPPVQICQTQSALSFTIMPLFFTRYTLLLVVKESPIFLP